MKKEFKFNNLDRESFTSMDIEFDKNSVYSMFIYDNKKDISHEIIFAFHKTITQKIHREIFLNLLYDNLNDAFLKLSKTISTNFELESMDARYSVEVTNLSHMQDFFDPYHDINIYDDCLVYYYENGEYKISNI